MLLSLKSSVSGTRCVVRLLIALLLFCSWPPFTVVETQAATGCSAPECFEEPGQSSASGHTFGEHNAMPSTSHMPVARAARLWPTGVGECEDTNSGRRLQAPAHDPPKTIRFCTLLI